jgi:hypothetical protein
MDEEYKRVAQQKYALFKKTQEKQQKAEQRAQNLAKWEPRQLELLTQMGYNPVDRICLLKSDLLEDNLGRSLLTHAEDLPWLYFKDGIAYDLRDIMWMADLPDKSPLQIQSGLGLTPEMWQDMTRQWEIVNPTPVENISRWTLYHTQAMTQDSFAETLGHQIYGITEKTPDLRGCGSIRIPPELMRYIQEQLADTYWAGKQPFLVMQLLFTKGHNKNWTPEFAVIPIGESLTNNNTLAISPALQVRSGVKVGHQVHGRLVTVPMICSSQNGVGVVLEFCKMFLSDATHESKDQDAVEEVHSKVMEQMLTKELESQFILVQNQWITLKDTHRIWLYRVKRLFSEMMRPVKVVSVYNAQIAIQLEVPKHEAYQLDSLPELLTQWSVLPHENM